MRGWNLPVSFVSFLGLLTGIAAAILIFREYRLVLRAEDSQLGFKRIRFLLYCLLTAYGILAALVIYRSGMEFLISAPRAIQDWVHHSKQEKPPSVKRRSSLPSSPPKKRRSQKLQGTEKRCAQGSAKACFAEGERMRREGRNAEADSYFNRACNLGYPPNCIHQ